jgi:hypothetical protein
MGIKRRTAPRRPIVRNKDILRARAQLQLVGAEDCPRLQRVRIQFELADASLLASDEELKSFKSLLRLYTSHTSSKYSLSAVRQCLVVFVFRNVYTRAVERLQRLNEIDAVVDIDESNLCHKTLDLIYSHSGEESGAEQLMKSLIHLNPSPPEEDSAYFATVMTSTKAAALFKTLKAAEQDCKQQAAEAEAEEQQNANDNDTICDKEDNHQSIVVQRSTLVRECLLHLTGDGTVSSFLTVTF